MAIVLGLFLGILGSVLAAPLWELIADRYYRLSIGSSFSVAGFWLAEFDSPTPTGSSSLELVQIGQRRDKIRLRIENYNNLRPSVLVLNGYGLYRSAQLTVIYYFFKSPLQDSGALLLRSLTGDHYLPILSGFYSQLMDRRPAGEIEFCSGPYTLRRVTIDRQRKKHRFRHGSWFNSYQELLDAKESLLAAARIVS